MANFDQSRDLPSFSSASDSSDLNFSQVHDDSAELIDIDELMENLQANVPKWLDAFRRQKWQGDREIQQKLVPMEKLLNEMQAELRNLKQNVDIPEVVLVFNPQIVQIVESAKAQGRKPNAIEDLGELVQDPEFLNSLQNGVNRWIESIRKVTRMDRDPVTGTALQEATFWINLERALVHINEIRGSDEVLLTLEALKAGRRFHAIVSFDSDTGLKEMLATTADHNQLMKDVHAPLNELLAASDLDAIHTAIGNVLSSIRKIRCTKYPVYRAIQFFSAISTDFCEKLIQLLKPRLLMHAPLAELEEIMLACKRIWALWDNEADKIQTIFREMVKRQHTTIRYLYRNMYKHKELEKRLEELYKFRRQHQQLCSVISRAQRQTGHNSLESIGPNPAKEVAKAYEAVKEVNCLDLSQAGQQAWENYMQYYKDHVGRIETQLASRLRDKLGGAKDADEMFAIFSRHNALFDRPHIRCAIREYQSILIDRVKADIVSLQQTIVDENKKDLAIRVASNYDIPDFSAKMMWLKQIESQLNLNMKRVEDVLGEGWTSHHEGKELKKECDLLRQKLNTEEIFKEWSEKIVSKCQEVSDKLFVIEEKQSDGKMIRQIRVNFSPDSLKISKEARNLKNMRFRIPFKIMTFSHNISYYYPYAISLLESLRVYESTNETVNQQQQHPYFSKLVANQRNKIHNLLQEGKKMEWSTSYRELEKYTIKLADVVANYQENVTDLIECLENIDVELLALNKCQYKAEAFSGILGTIQKTIGQMALNNNYSNLNIWIEKLDKELEAKLAARVEEAIHVWTMELKQCRDELEEERDANIKPEIHKIPLEIRIVNQHITVVPTMEKAKASLLEQFSNWHAIITEQPRIFCTQNQQSIQPNSSQTYKDVLMKMSKGQQMLNEAYKAIDDVLKKTSDYVNQWTSYQALWDLQLNNNVFFERLGNDLVGWMKAILDIKKSRALVDSPASQHQLHPFVVVYDRVQSKISMKYELWQREVLQKFGVALGTSMQHFFADISRSRLELEAQGIDSSNTSGAVTLITQVQMLKKKVEFNQKQVDIYIAAQKVLSGHRFTFPQTWLYAEHVKGEWSAFLAILNRKDVSTIQSQSNLQTRIQEELEVQEKAFLWNNNRWHISSDQQLVQVTANGLVAKKAVQYQNGDFANVRARQHVSRAIFANLPELKLVYWEVLVKKSHVPCVGWVNSNFPLKTEWIGYLPGSFSIDCSGNYLESGRTVECYGTGFDVGDVVGTGFTRDGKLFFTKNGRLNAEPIVLQDSQNLLLYPAVNLFWKDAAVEANFGADPEKKPFQFDVNAHELFG